MNPNIYFDWGSSEGSLNVFRDDIVKFRVTVYDSVGKPLINTSSGTINICLNQGDLHVNLVELKLVSGSDRIEGSNRVFVMEGVMLGSQYSGGPKTKVMTYGDPEQYLFNADYLYIQLMRGRVGVEFNVATYFTCKGYDKDLYPIDSDDVLKEFHKNHGVGDRYSLYINNPRFKPIIIGTPQGKKPIMELKVYTL